ncbi:tetratricopeptide repeat protein [Roseisolibacter agri]|uniref:Tetratricopeptide repeat protein n=1 Tax=Roseisolibacter agri TaxID=2014610 RepID=A0AA37QIL0_9BACT|nr:tetratricopeptide repeat protein [Roseisolibacter agri]GLC27528.1 hypothetical protein rosag_40410 [Roseisolibacter agri]
MSALAKIKKQAAQLEHDRQYDKALALYTRLLDASPEADDEIDVALYNRAGDVALRAGDTPRAVTYYERALDLYAAGGFLNNAIALGAKILRQAPERAATHYTLGVLHAKKGFRSDARQHFLTYAERMQRGGQGGEVARSLADYVVLCDGAADARAGLAAHLATGGARPADQSAKLQELLDQALRAAGLGDEATAEFETPRAGGASRNAAAADLVFLDLDAAAIEEAAAAHEAPLDLLSSVDFSEPAAAEAPAWADAPSIDLDLSAPAATGAPLASLPGELPPLAPSMVALDGGRGDGDWAHAAESPLAIDVDVPVGVPAFADADLASIDLESAVVEHAVEAPVGLGLELLDVEPLDVEAPDTPDESPVAWSDASVDLPLLVDDFAADVAAAPAVEQAAEQAEEPLLELEAHDLVSPVAQVAAPAPAPEPAPAAAVVPDSDGLDLGAWLRDSEPAKSTRLIAPTMPTTGDEEADFQATLQAFKAGIARSLEDADFDAHYDLGVAYKEMGLLEEAIGEFQKAARAPGRPLRAMEALASCFLERGEPDLVLSTLAPVAGTLSGDAPATSEAPQQVALCYLLGAASQEVGRVDDARAWYLRVLATDYAFRDAATRLASLSPPTR